MSEDRDNPSKWFTGFLALCITLCALALAYVQCTPKAYGQDYNVPFRPRATATPNIAFVQANSSVASSGGSESTSCTTPSLTTTAGNLLVCAIKHEANTANTLGSANITAGTDSSSAAYTIGGYIMNDNGAGDRVAAGMVYIPNVGAGARTVTINIDSGRKWFMCACSEYSGVKTVSALDTTYGTSGIVTQAADNTADLVFSSSTTGNAAVVVCAITNGSSATQGTQTTTNDDWIAASFNERFDAPSGNEICLADRIVTSATSVGTPGGITTSTSSTRAGVCMSFLDF